MAGSALVDNVLLLLLLLVTTTAAAVSGDSSALLRSSSTRTVNAFQTVVPSTARRKTRSRLTAAERPLQLNDGVSRSVLRGSSNAEDVEISSAFCRSWPSTTPRVHLHRNPRQYKRRRSSARSSFFPLWSSPQDYWEGDDVRWWTRLRRRFRPSVGRGANSPNCRNALVSLNVLVFIYQIATTVNSLRVRFPSHWPRHALSMVADAAWGSSVAGPLTLDFASSPRLGRLQPHRFVTAGFLHGGILHLLLNVDALRRTPDWLETGLGVPLYLTTYLLSIVAGNFGHSLGSAASVGAGQSLCLGSSGGICGLYGLMWISLARMGNQSAASRVARGVALIFLYGALIPDVSNASHVGGFVAGALIGFLFGPSYAKSYAMRRKWSVEVDNSPKDYRLAMGFGKRPSKSGMLPLSALWVVVGATLLSQAKFRSMPRLVLQGLLKPGSVYAQLFR